MLEPLVVPADSGTLKFPLVGWDLSEILVLSGLFLLWKPTKVPRDEWGFQWPSGNSPVFHTKCTLFCCNRDLFHDVSLNAHHLSQLRIVSTRKHRFQTLSYSLSTKNVDLLTHSAKYRVGEFDVDPTRYPRGKWGFSNKNPTSGPPTVGFPRVVLSLVYY